MTGELSVLNCSAGDIRVEFDKANPMEVERARRIIRDMLKRGYILFVEAADGTLRKVTGFNAKNDCYVIADGPLYAGEDDDANTEESTPKKGRTKKGKTRKTEVPIKNAKATGIAPTAGG